MVAVSSQSKTATIDTDGTVCRVSDRVLEVKIDDVVTIKNATADSISILISEEKLFEEYKFKIDAGKDATLTVRDVAVGDYLYAVFCREIDDFAQASSMPIIAVRR